MRRGQGDVLHGAFKLIYLVRWLKELDQQIHEHKLSIKLCGWRKVDLRSLKNRLVNTYVDAVELPVLVVTGGDVETFS